MTRVIVETGNVWTQQRIRTLVQLEVTLLRRVLRRTQQKIQAFERQYGVGNLDDLYGRVDDLTLIEWEGEIETLNRLRQKLAAMEEISLESR